jgi:hypothetical protein
VNLAQLGEFFRNLWRPGLLGGASGRLERRSNERGQQKRTRSHRQRRADSHRLGKPADEIRPCGAGDAADVVHESHGAGAQLGGEQFAGDDAEAGKVSGSEEADQRPDDEQRVRIADEREERY